MFKFALALFILLQETPLAITSPQSGDTLRGQVEINGEMDIAGFAFAELAFSYAASDFGDVWFPIRTFSNPPADSLLAVWDTTAITDGDYRLRLRVFLEDGSAQETIVHSLKVRNDTPEATVTPTEDPFPPFMATTPPPVRTEPTPTAPPVQPSPTPMPANPASVTADTINAAFGRGALTALGLFVFAALILRLRKNA